MLINGIQFWRCNVVRIQSVFSMLSRRIVLFLSVFIWIASANAQLKPLKLISQAKDSVVVASGVTYLRGIGDPSATLWLDDQQVPIYGTGAFAAAISLDEGRNESLLTYVSGGDTLRRRIVFEYQRPVPPQPTEGFAISYVK